MSKEYDRDTFSAVCKQKKCSSLQAEHAILGQVVKEYSIKLGCQEQEIMNFGTVFSFKPPPKSIKDVTLGNNWTPFLQPMRTS